MMCYNSGKYFSERDVFMDKFNSPEYVRSRKAYVVQCTVEYFVSILVADVFLAKLLSSLGISDSLVGIIASFITLAFVIQLFTLQLVKVKVSAKKLVMTLDTASIFFFMFMYLIPFVPAGKTVKTVLMVVSILFAYICKYLNLNICFRWANGYVAPDKRASFSAGKEMVSLLSGMVFTAIVGYIVDKFEMNNNLSGGFLFISLVILVLNICNFISFALIKKDSVEEKNLETSEPVREVLHKTLGNKNFRRVIMLTVLFDIARYFSGGFMGIYKSKDLMMSVFLVQVINITANLMRFLISKPMGRYSDKKSFAKGFELALWIEAIAFFICIFTTKSTWYLIIIYTILRACATAGTNANSYNIVYSYVDSKYIVQAMAIKNCIGGLFGFGASVLGGMILDYVQKNGNSLFGLNVYGQQVLTAISFVVIVISIIYIRKTIVKQKVMIQ